MDSNESRHSDEHHVEWHYSQVDVSVRCRQSSPCGHAGTSIFAATSHGVYGSTDNGSPLDRCECRASRYHRLTLAAANGYLFAATDAGVWRRLLSEITSVPENSIATHGLERISQCQNYPNPFNPSSEIGYQISEFRHVTLVVYDLLGREVAVLVNEPKSPGSYEVKFDGSNLPSGVYFYRLPAGSYRRDEEAVARAIGTFVLLNNLLDLTELTLSRNGGHGARSKRKQRNDEDLNAPLQ